jgi:ATP-dependent Zn protease
MDECQPYSLTAPEYVGPDPGVDEDLTPESLVVRREVFFREGSPFAPVNTEDIVGIDRVLEDLDEVVHWLQNPERYAELNARCEPGIILAGPPGTGKTMTARWIATESKAHFINMREWPRTKLEMTAEDIAALYECARAFCRETGKPVILFCDEFEGYARARFSDGITPTQTGLIEQFLEELSGIKGNNYGLLTVGCTNHLENIDSALKRDGRMGLHYYFSAPDRPGKSLLLQHYLKEYNVGDIDYDNLSYFFESDDHAAVIEEACMKAWRNACRHAIKAGTKLPVLGEQDLIKVFIRHLVGPPPTFMDRSADDILQTAIHEVGHALAALLNDIPLRLITVQAGKMSLGRTIFAGVREHVATVGELRAHIRLMYGSIAAEKLCGIEDHVGPNGDRTSATALAHQLVDDMAEGGNTGLVSFKSLGGGRNNLGAGIGQAVSHRLLDGADEDVQKILITEYIASVRDMRGIGANEDESRGIVETLAKILVERVTMTGPEFRAEVDKLGVRLVRSQPDVY